MREFIIIFLTDLPSVPLDRGIHFAIYVDPGTKPIFVVPYRMAWAELKERFIRSSVFR